MNDDFLEKLGELGVDQWIANFFVSKVKEFQKAKNTDVDKFINEFSNEIAAAFHGRVNACVNRFIATYKELTQKQQDKR